MNTSEDPTEYLKDLAQRVVAVHKSVHSSEENKPNRVRDIFYYGSPDEIAACEDAEWARCLEVVNLYRATMREYANLPYGAKLQVNNYIEADSDYYAKAPQVLDLREKKDRSE